MNKVLYAIIIGLFSGISNGEEIQQDKPLNAAELNIETVVPSTIPTIPLSTLMNRYRKLPAVNSLIKPVARQPLTTSAQVIVFDIHGVLMDFSDTIIPEGAQLLQKCALAGHTIMILSNGGTSDIGALYMKYYDEILKYIKKEHILIAQLNNTIKPLDSAYQAVREIVSKDPALANKNVNIFFIDDSRTNVLAGLKNNFFSFKVGTPQSFAAVENYFKEIGLLP